MFIALIIILMYDIIIVQSISNIVYHLTISNYIYKKFFMPLTSIIVSACLVQYKVINCYLVRQFLSILLQFGEAIGQAVVIGQFCFVLVL